jgi:MoaA/NifB/PqqE/SkfB family radical SAM enzyme
MANIKNTDYHQARIDYSKKIYDDPSMLPHRYVFVLTNRCNLKCSFCFQEKDRIEGSLTTEEWLELIDQLPEYAHVTLTGGEPFLFKGFEEVFKAVTKKHTCNIISNGLLLTEEIIELLLSTPNFKVLSISVDDIGNIVRDVVPDQWLKAEELMRRFSKKRDEHGASTVLDSKTVVLDENANDLFDIHKYCIEKLKCDTHSFMLLKGSPIQYADHMIPIENMMHESKAYVYKKLPIILNELEKVRKYNITMNKKCFLHPKVIELNSAKPLNNLDLGFINNGSHNVSDFKECKAPWESVHINVDGNLFPCMAIKMGNVKEQKLTDIISSSVFKEFKDTIREKGTVGGCNRCGYLLPKDSPKVLDKNLGQEIKVGIGNIPIRVI